MIKMNKEDKIEVVDSWQGDAFYHFHGVAELKGDLMCARMVDGKECGGELLYISPHHLQCDKCLVVNVLKKEENEQTPHDGG